MRRRTTQAGVHARGANSGGGGAIDFSNVPLETLIVTDGWTQAVRGTLQVTSTSYSADGVGTYTFNGASSTIDTFPIWYQQAYTRDGSGQKQVLTTSDTFFVQGRVSQVGEPDFPLSAAFELTLNPTGTYTQYRPMGCGVNRAPSDTRQFMFLHAADGHSFFGSSLTNRTADFTISHVGGSSPRRTRVIANISDASGNFIAASERQDINTIETAGQPIYLAMHVYPYDAGNPPQTGEQCHFKMQFRCMKYGE